MTAAPITQTTPTTPARTASPTARGTGWGDALHDAPPEAALTAWPAGWLTTAPGWQHGWEAALSRGRAGAGAAGAEASATGAARQVLAGAAADAACALPQPQAMGSAATPQVSVQVQGPGWQVDVTRPAWADGAAAALHVSVRWPGAPPAVRAVQAARLGRRLATDDAAATVTWLDGGRADPHGGA